MLAGSFFLFFQSYADNTFLSPLVRIQEERKHKVVSTGVYRFVRHPMCLGAILMFFGAPLVLGSSCGVVDGLALGRPAHGQDRRKEAMLTRELEGYKEYTRAVRYRLFPGVW